MINGKQRDGWENIPVFEPVTCPTAGAAGKSSRTVTKN